MADLKIQHILTLSYLLSVGAGNAHVVMTTSSLGRGIGKSQQAASKHLADLEQGGFVERTAVAGRPGVSVRVTPKGSLEVTRLSATLQRRLEAASAPPSQPPSVEIRGTLVSGMGEGAYYVGHEGYAKQFRSKLGYVPYPGTLNVRLDPQTGRDVAGRLGELPGTRIMGFSDGQRTYGRVKCLAARLNGSADCTLIIPERTHHDDSVIELISRSSLREQAGLRDGSKVSVVVSAVP